MDFEELAEYHVNKRAAVTIATIPVNAQDAPGFGIMKVNNEGDIEKFYEKPKSDILSQWSSPVTPELEREGRIYLASMGIYMFNKEVLFKLFEDYPEAVDFGKEFIPTAIESGMKVSSYAFDSYWTDIGTIRSFFEANIALTDILPKFNLFDNDRLIYTRPRMLPPAKVFGTWFNQAILADGSVIHAKKIERSVVGIRSRIGYNTEITRAIIMGSDYFERLETIVKSDETPMGIGNDCFIENAILDKNCRIGHNVIIRGDDSLQNDETDTYCIRDGIIVVKKGAIIPDGSRIGRV
jgi:glucose-1-phosphate adenylyltransferase